MTENDNLRSLEALAGMPKEEAVERISDRMDTVFQVVDKILLESPRAQFRLNDLASSFDVSPAELVVDILAAGQEQRHPSESIQTVIINGAISLAEEVGLHGEGIDLNDPGDEQL